MSGVKGRRFGSTVYAPNGAAKGAVAYVGEGTDGLQIFFLPYPVDGDTVDYELHTGPSGIPEWRATGLAPTEFPLLGETEPSGGIGSVRNSDGDLLYVTPE